MKKKLSYFLILFLFFSSCAGEKASEKETLTIAVAANVQFAIKEIESKFEEITKIKVDVIIGSSGKLTAQIKQGAPYDVLISANMKYPEILFKEGNATTVPKIYAYGSLVLWTMKGMDLENGLGVLTNNEVVKIGIANPKNAPYGEEAIKAFKYSKIYKAIESKLVYGESVAQTNQYILSKSVEAGITAKSVVLSAELQGKGTWIDINSAAYNPIAQGVVITKYGAKHHAKIANTFYEFLFSPKAAGIFEKYGYSISE